MWESRSAPRSRPLLETRRADGKAGRARLRRRFDRLRSLHPFAERHPGAGDHRGLALVLAGAAVQRREQAEIDVHRLERSEEHPSELQSLMRTSYARFYLKKKTYIYL